jgi:hypothetical protein
MQSIVKVYKKIKDFIDPSWIDSFFLCSLMLCVAFVSFSLGIRYERDRYERLHPIRVQFSKEALSLWERYQFEKQEYRIDGFVASKNGTLVYPADCAGAKRIKEENKVYFGSIQEALDMGYKESTNC